jgi:AraC-like DNA-binding protein
MITYKYSRFSDEGGFPIGVKFMPAGTSVGMEFHDHEFSEIAIVTAGTATHKVGNESFPLKTGDVLIVHPGCTHAYGDTKDMGMLNIIYDAKMPLPALESCGLPFVLKLFPGKYPDSVDSLTPVVQILDEDIEPIYELTRRLDYEVRHLRPGKQVLILAIFMEIIVYLARCDSNVNPVKKFNFALNEVINYMDKHYAEKITIANLQKAAKMSERNLFRHFRNVFSISPNEYLHHIRVQHATELLLNTDKQISKIALECGYCDSNHFGKVFKKMVGATPKQFRRQKRWNVS